MCVLLLTVRWICVRIVINCAVDICAYCYSLCGGYVCVLLFTVRWICVRMCVFYALWYISGVSNWLKVSLTGLLCTIRACTLGQWENNWEH